MGLESDRVPVSPPRLFSALRSRVRMLNATVAGGTAGCKYVMYVVLVISLQQHSRIKYTAGMQRTY